MSNEIPIICPNCGAHAYYPEGGHVAVCPYCDCRVVIDDAESEVKLDNLQREAELLRTQARRRAAIDEDEAKYNRKLKKWRRRVRMLIGASFLSTIFVFLVFAEDLSEDLEDLAGMLLLLTLIGCVIGPPMLAAFRPSFSRAPGEGKTSIPSRILLALMLYGSCFTTIVSGAFVAYIIENIFFL